VVVPLDIAWETPLVIYSGGSPAPMGIVGEARALQPAQCDAHVVKPFVENDDPKLVIVGKALGACDVEFRYRHPTRDVTMSAMLHIVFMPAETLPEVDVGSAMPGAPFVVGHVPDDFRNRTPSGAPVASADAAPAMTARCETSEDSDRFRCFPLERAGDGQGRYSSCRHSRRCSVMPGGIVVDGFSLCIEVSEADRHVTGMVATTGAYGQTPKEIGKWGTVARACAH
jgi:hypothetical protein